MSITSGLVWFCCARAPPRPRQRATNTEKIATLRHFVAAPGKMFESKFTFSLRLAFQSSNDPAVVWPRRNLAQVSARAPILFARGHSFSAPDKPSPTKHGLRL